MKTEVRCDACGQGFVAEVEGETEIPCPFCGTALSVAAERAPDETQTAPSPLSVEEEPVVCPRCGLHFRPRGAAAASAVRQRRRVLVLEDMDYFQEIVREALEPRYEVRMAPTIAEAERILRHEGVDLIVVDPGLNGGDGALRWLSALDPKPCPILVFTAEDESELYGAPWKRLRELGADDIVLKGLHAGEALQRKAAALLGEPADELESL